MPSINELAQKVYDTAFDIRTACEEYTAKKLAGRDPKQVFTRLTDSDIEAALKAVVKSAYVAHRNALTALRDQLKAEVDGTIA